LEGEDRGDELRLLDAGAGIGFPANSAGEPLNAKTGWRMEQSGSNPSLAVKFPDKQGKNREFMRFLV